MQWLLGLQADDGRRTCSATTRDRYQIATSPCPITDMVLTPSVPQWPISKDHSWWHFHRISFF
jgi:hypothetical protein